MESLLAIQADIKDRIIKAKDNFMIYPRDRLSVPYVEIRLENLEQHWSLFTSTHTKIISTIKKAELHCSDYYKKSLYDEIEDLYISYKTDLKELLLQLNKCNDSLVYSSSGHKQADSSNSVIKLKLPEFKIPVFSGKYTEFQTFRELFLGLVHNNESLDNAQKFFYLKGHLTGDAEQLLRNIPVTSDNYESSWEKLEHMYNNKRFIANNILNRLLNQKSLLVESASEIKHLISTTTDCLNCIKNLGVDVSSWDIIIVHLISAKLDKATRKAWELKVSSEGTDNLPTFAQFEEFLTNRFRGLENMENHHPPKLSNTDRGTKHTTSLHARQLTCKYCAQSHRLGSCNKFHKQSPDTRRHFVKENGLCFICLGPNHTARFCKYRVRCKICKGRHHTLLHPTSSVYNTVHREEGMISSNCSKVEAIVKPVIPCTSNNSGRKSVLLPTTLVKAESENGSHRIVRALCDQGSEGSFITEAMVQALGLKKQFSKYLVTGVGGDGLVNAKCKVALVLRSRIEPFYEVQVQARVLRTITPSIPATQVDRLKWDAEIEKKLADPGYYYPNSVDMLLGADVYSKILRTGLKRCPSGAIAQDTRFGWIISGDVPVASKGF